MHIRLEVRGGHLLLTLCISDWRSLTGINNNNEYFERLTRLGPKHLHILYKYILSKFNAYNMTVHTRTHTHTENRREFITHFVYIRLELEVTLTGGHLLLTLSVCAHQTESHRKAFITHFVYIGLEVTGGHLLLTLCTSGWKSQEGISGRLLIAAAFGNVAFL